MGAHDVVRHARCGQPADRFHDAPVWSDAVLHEGDSTAWGNYDRRVQGDVPIRGPASARPSAVYLFPEYQPLVAPVGRLPRIAAGLHHDTASLSLDGHLCAYW